MHCLQQLRMGKRLLVISTFPSGSRARTMAGSFQGHFAGRLFLVVVFGG